MGIYPPQNTEDDLTGILEAARKVIIRSKRQEAHSRENLLQVSGPYKGVEEDQKRRLWTVEASLQVPRKE